MRIEIAVNDADIARCYSVMAELRPHLHAEEFPERIRRQQQQGYQLAYLESEGEVKAVAGFRMGDNLAWGRYMYVDDLVTSEVARSGGLGEALFDWLVAYARKQGCNQLHLDSGVQRFRAHQFYLRKKMIISSHHFALVLDG